MLRVRRGVSLGDILCESYKVRTLPIFRSIYELNASLTEIPVGCNLMTELEMCLGAQKTEESHSHDEGSRGLL